MRRLVPIAISLVLAVVLLRDSSAEHALLDYRYFRALSIDLLGRVPSDTELAEFEQPGFDLDKWIDVHLQGAAYAARLSRIYMDALRLDAGAFRFNPGQSTLVAQTILGPDGTQIYVYFRHGQRRLDPVTDGEFCLTRDDTGYEAPSKTVHGGVAKRVTQAVLDAKTVVVKPWWLYADYRARDPAAFISPDWSERFGYELGNALLLEPDGHTRTTAIRVCKEEAQTGDRGAVFKRGTGTPSARDDTALARKAPGSMVSCTTFTGFRNSVECGCGVGVERCLPGDRGFMTPMDIPLGTGVPFLAGLQPTGEWLKAWWTQEAEHFFDRVFTEDLDFREVLLGRWTMVNGPLALFYRAIAADSCCGPGADIGYLEPDPLVQPSAMPDKLPAVDTQTWELVADRGSHAAGIATMPVFLTKYGSRRARAHVLYNAFLCKDFVASKVKLEPSNEPDLTKRPGCSACHYTLEPMAAYFTRIPESDWTWLPARTFPAKGCPDLPRNETCYHVYDPTFNALGGAYAAAEHADAGPIGLAREITTSPEFASCVVQNVAQSLLGRPLTTAENGWKRQLAGAFIDGGYRVRSLVRAIVRSPEYRALVPPQPGTP